MHWCAYHKQDEPDENFRTTKYGKLASYCIEGYKEYNKPYGKIRDAPRKAEVAKRREEKAQATTKVCTECKLEKPVEDFPERSDRKGKRHAKCNKCYTEHRRRQNNESYDRNKPKRVQEARDKRAENPEHYLQKHKEYEERRREDPVRQREWQLYQNLFAHNRRLQEKEAKGFCTVEQWKARIDVYGHRCYICKCDYDALPSNEQTIEHVIPISKGGTNWPANLRPACLSCNLSKWAKLPSLPSRFWYKRSKMDQKARLIADNHYSRRSKGSKQFVQPGRSLVLTTKDYDALWVSMWPYAQYVRHAWPDSWFCQIFRNEGSTLSSTLVKEAVAITLEYWKFIPEDGFITFVNPKKIQSNKNPGYCFLKAGFEKVGTTQSGLVVLQMSRKRLESIFPRDIK